MDYAFIGNLEQQKCKQYAIHENIKKYQKCNNHEYNRILVTFRSSIVFIKYQFVEISTVQQLQTSILLLHIAF